MRKKSRRFLLFFAPFLAGWLGGWSAQWFCPVSPAAADSRVLQADQLWIYGQDGRQRLQMATYVNPGEQGLPLIGLSDNSGRLRLLFRLAGPDGSPVLVFKDRNGTDRMVMGLDYSGGDEAPFLRYTDGTGGFRSLLDQAQR